MNYPTEARRSAMRVCTVMLLLVFATFTAVAQEPPGMMLPEPEEIEPVTDEELETFASAFNDVQVLQAELDAQMNEALDASELGSQRFLEINELVQRTTPGEEIPGVSDEEFAAYEEIFDYLINVQYEIQMKMVEAVLDRDMDIERFNEIAMAVQFDAELLERLRPYLAEEQFEGV
jgi:hypothetical protein